MFHRDSVYVSNAISMSQIALLMWKSFKICSKKKNIEQKYPKNIVKILSKQITKWINYKKIIFLTNKIYN